MIETEYEEGDTVASCYVHLDCGNCGHKTISPMVSLGSLCEEDQKAFMDLIGVDEWVSVDFDSLTAIYAIPLHLKCLNCGEVFHEDSELPDNDF